METTEQAFLRVRSSQLFPHQMSLCGLPTFRRSSLPHNFPCQPGQKTEGYLFSIIVSASIDLNRIKYVAHWLRAPSETRQRRLLGSSPEDLGPWHAVGGWLRE